MASWSILSLLLVLCFKTVDSQTDEAGCTITDVRKELMELMVDHNTRLINLIAKMTGSESCQSDSNQEGTTDDDSVGSSSPERTIQSSPVLTTSTQVTSADAVDCMDIKSQGSNASGVYNVSLGGCGMTTVYCDMDTDGGGWTVFQRRTDGDVDFYLSWIQYSAGFGNVSDEFWLGNDNLHSLTSLGETELRIDLEDFEGNAVYAHYDSFFIGNASTFYVLNVSGFSGNAGDSLSYHSGSYFSTNDADHDGHSTNCAANYYGAWWYKSCHYSNLNGKYLSGTTGVYAQGITWHHWKGYYYSIKTTKMMARRVLEKR